MRYQVFRRVQLFPVMSKSIQINAIKNCGAYAYIFQNEAQFYVFFAGMHCALKVMNKADLVRANQHHNATRERNLLEWVSFPLIVELVSSFKDNLNVYLVLKFIPGGELFSYVHRLGKLPEKQVKFYGAQMVLFLEYLHNLDIIYRDIKPENILISANGYIKGY